MSALLDALDYLGGALDKPGRAVRGVLGGRPDEALAAVPFSDSLGWTDQANAVSGRDLLNRTPFATGNDLIDEGLGFGAEMVLDPTTYLGAGIVSRLAGKGGRALEAAARARGPGYGTTADDLLGQADRLDDPEAAVHRIEAIRKAAPRAFAEVPEGSRLLGAGAEGLAARTPAGDVVRLGVVPPGLPGRPVSPEVLQATRAADFPGTRFEAICAERTPFAERVGEDFWLEPGGDTDLTPLDELVEAARRQGLDFADDHPGNAGLLGGRAVIIDPGAVQSLHFTPFAGRYQDVTPAGEPSALLRALLDLLGGRPAMRRALDAGLAAPRYEQNLGYLGGAAGASVGTT